MSRVIIKYKKLVHNAKAPFRAHVDDAGADICATSVEQNKAGVYCYGTGLSFEVPKGFHLEIRPRSSIYKTGLVLANSPGTIDCGYTGEVRANFYGVLPEEYRNPYFIGDRIAQIIVPNVPYTDVEFVEVDEIGATVRGNSGFGSTGV